MKKRRFSMLFPGLMVGLFILSISILKAQPFLSDGSVHTGRLDNGMDYYLQNNPHPEGQVELRLVVNMGSLVEDSSQQGFAHFVEHMCFNGTRHFPGNQVIDYLESKGMRFGRQFNAYTSFAETVYQLTLPTDDLKLLENGFQILEDWAAYVSFQDREIEKERGVIIQEWRTGQGPGERLRRQYYPVLFGDARYTHRLPIGKKPVLESFHPQELRDFYNHWYKPELMSVIVVGDLPVEKSEELVHRYFGTIPKDVHSEQPKVYPVADKKKIQSRVLTDEEATKELIRIYFYQDKWRVEDRSDFKTRLQFELITGMINQRFSRMSQNPDSPFLYAHCSRGKLVRTKDLFSYTAVARNRQLLNGYKKLLKENRRLVLHGFNQVELSRQKKILLNRYKEQALESDKLPSDQRAEQLKLHVLEDRAVISPEQAYSLAKDAVPEIRIGELEDQFHQWVDKNPVIIATLPKGHITSGLTDRNLHELYQKSLHWNPEPLKRNVVRKSLDPGFISNGKIVAEKSYETLDITEWKLSNGARVILKPTDFSNNKVLFTSISKGGRAMYDDHDYISAYLSSRMAYMSGVKDMKRTEIKDLLAGKNVRIAPWINRFVEGSRGSCAPDELEILLKLNYLYFTQPRFDSSAIKGYLSRFKTQVSSLRNAPDFIFSDTLVKALHGGSSRYFYMPGLQRLEQLNQLRAQQIYQERFAHAGDFTFVFVGNVDSSRLRPLAEKYIGGLPALSQPDSLPQRKRYRVQEEKNIQVYAGKEDKSYVKIVYTGLLKGSGQDDYTLTVLTELLKMNLRRILREEKSGVYGIGVTSETHELPCRSYRLDISFGCAPSVVDELIKAVENEIQSLQNKGPQKQDLLKARKVLEETHHRQVKKNRYWQEQLAEAAKLDDARYINRLVEYLSRIKRVRIQQVRNVAKDYLADDRRIIVTLFPEGDACQ